MKHIIIPTDFSLNAQKATDYGLQLFDSKNYIITLLNTLYLPAIEAGAKFNRNGATQAKAEKAFKNEINRIQKKFPSNRASLGFRFELGDIVNVVEFILKSEEIYAIVMGTKGSNNSKEDLIGSRTSHMVKNIQYPIFVIPENAVFTSIKKVLLTTDLELIPLDKSIELIRDLCDNHNASIDLLHVTNKDFNDPIFKNVKKKLSELLSPIDHSFVTTEGDDVANSIWSYTLNCKPDILISVSEKKGFFQRIFLKSVTRELALHTDLPMLVINGQDYG